MRGNYTQFIARKQHLEAQDILAKNPPTVDHGDTYPFTVQRQETNGEVLFFPFNALHGGYLGGGYCSRESAEAEVQRLYREYLTQKRVQSHISGVLEAQFNKGAGK